MKNKTEELLTDTEVLEAFLIENPDLERLELLLSEFNLFEAVGVVRQELRHSDFLGFLLDPRQSHGLGDAFLTLFLRRVVQSSDLTSLPFSAIDLTLWDLADTEVKREWRRIDLLILSRTHKFAIVIENKIGTGEHSNQLQRYKATIKKEFKDWTFLGIYLTPDGEEPSDPAFLPCSYKVVHQAIGTLLQGRASMGEDVRAAIRHYDQLLQRHVVSESEIAALCHRIYQRHKRALDLIYEHRPDRVAFAQEILLNAARGHPGIELDQCSKNHVRFTPVEWDTGALRQGAGWTSTGRMVLFEFRGDYRGIVLQLYLGPGPLNVREHVFTAACELSAFQPPSSSLKRKWNALAKSQVVISISDLEELDEESIEERLVGFWERFVVDPLPDMVTELTEALEGIPD
jgi:hypothetical protein